MTLDEVNNPRDAISTEANNPRDVIFTEAIARDDNQILGVDKSRYLPKSKVINRFIIRVNLMSKSEVGNTVVFFFHCSVYHNCCLLYNDKLYRKS